jgi:hypothetical protein
VSDASLRTSIVAWSTFSGVVLGLLAALLLVGVGTLVSSAMPTVQRLLARRATTIVVALLVVLPLVGAVLGLLEGRLKTR